MMLYAVYTIWCDNIKLAINTIHTSDDHNPRTAGLLGQKLAKFHSLKPPIPKDSTEGTVNFDQWFDENQRQSLREGWVREEIVTNQLNTFLARDLLAEMSWLRHQVLAIKSPVLFSHNDFNRTNILIRDLNPDNNQLDIYFVDFDFSSYNYRGCDFGNYFSTWASDSAEFGVDSRFPTDRQMWPFIDGYIREMTAINGNSFTQLEINSFQRLIKEAKRTVNGSDDSTELMKKAEIRFKCYTRLKDRIVIVSAEDRLNVYELCKTYLGGEWADVRADDLVIKPAKGGFINKLLYCSLPDTMSAKYLKVVVKYHGNVMAVAGSHYFNASDDLNPKTVALLAQKLAKLHSLNMPIPKDRTEIYMRMIFEEWLKEPDIESLRHGLVRQEIQKNNLKTLMSTDFVAEMAWVRKVMVSLNSPVVFSHNDLNRRNILVTNNNNNVDVYIIDFDWSCYMYRGADLGDYFVNWCQQDYGPEVFPTDDQMLVFIDAYIRELTAINGNSFTQLEINSQQRLINIAPKAENRIKVYKELKNPEDRLNVYELCKTYLGGEWTDVCADNLVIKPATLSHYFNASDDLNPKTVALLAQKLAKLHSLDMPIPKDKAEEYMSFLFDDWLKKSDIESLRHGLVRQEIQKNNLFLDYR
ncbi:unnamed protein product [Medioppia subpectinata]|uniref:Uncharacterized protein n=1 Tax=Medioppia subpectinata TaxID=1979941 RepID=A0A7R9KHT5_9ACAR|nr:unnamed protein product [Medioppia subpectinata]CAG2102829.1 unnamed protein product [Medioppia subpectinata]